MVRSYDDLFDEVMLDKLSRKEYLRDDFVLWARFYFPQYFNFSDPWFNLKYAKDLQNNKNIFFESFRWSAKTTRAQLYILRCICYKRKRNIMRYSYNKSDSEKNIWYIANMLIGSPGDNLTDDRWQLYYEKPTGENLQKESKTMSRFITKNKCSVRALSLWTSPRWDNYTTVSGKYRPDLLVFDDVDVLKSVSSWKIIDKNRRFIEDEVFGGVTAKTQLIFLGNTINQDWIIPRIKTRFSNNPLRSILRVPIYDEQGKIQRDRFVETISQAKILNEDISDITYQYTSLEGERLLKSASSFAQNYLLIPYLDGDTIIKRHMIDYNCSSDNISKTIMWVDPAFSEKTTSDPLGIVITTHTKGVQDDAIHYNIKLSVWLSWLEKSEDNVIKTIKSLYTAHNISLIRIEWNNGWELIGKRLKKEWCAVTIVYSAKDKVTRLREKERFFDKHLVHFNDKPWSTEALVEQLIHFPNVSHDDEVDAMLLSMDWWWDMAETIKEASKALTPPTNNWNNLHSYLHWMQNHQSDKF